MNRDAADCTCVSKESIIHTYTSHVVYIFRNKVRFHKSKVQNKKKTKGDVV